MLVSCMCDIFIILFTLHYTYGVSRMPANINKSIEEVNFSGNSFTELKEDYFKDFVNLKYIYFGSNQISYIEDNTFNNLHQLQLINLCYNNLTKLQTNLFSDLENLESIRLIGNQISVIEEDCFNNLPSIRVIDLSDNHLQTLDIKIIDDFNIIKCNFVLHNNPWTCDQNLCPVMNLFSKSNYYKPKCINHKFSNKDWNEVLTTMVPTITSNQTSIIRGDTISLECKVCVTSKIIFWKYNNEYLKRNQNIYIQQSRDKLMSTLIIKNVRQNGTYSCHTCVNCTGGVLEIEIKENLLQNISAITETIFTTEKSEKQNGILNDNIEISDTDMSNMPAVQRKRYILKFNTTTNKEDQVDMSNNMPAVQRMRNILKFNNTSTNEEDQITDTSIGVKQDEDLQKLHIQSKSFYENKNTIFSKENNNFNNNAVLREKYLNNLLNESFSLYKNKTSGEEKEEILLQGKFLILLGLLIPLIVLCAFIAIIIFIYLDYSSEEQINQHKNSKKTDKFNICINICSECFESNSNNKSKYSDSNVEGFLVPLTPVLHMRIPVEQQRLKGHAELYGKEEVDE